MKFFPKKLSLKWINQAYDNNELTPYELVDEILKRAEENKDKNIWIVAPSRELMEKYISKLPPRSEDKPLWGIPFAIKDNIDLEGGSDNGRLAPNIRICRKKVRLWYRS